MKRAVRIVIGNIAVFVCVIVLIEGIASTGLFLLDILGGPKQKTLARQHYAKYDPELGWINKSNLDLADVYGPGGYVKTNAQGFRTDHPVANPVPQGKVRIICSGDSYTFGYGVDNKHTWCELFGQYNPRFEAVNIGGDGYGVDQAFLRYKKQTASMEHQVHFFAFITDDFYRMLLDSFLGYGKPVLNIEKGALVVTNTPVPVEGSYAPHLARTVERAKDLRLYELIRRFRRKFEGNAVQAAPHSSTAVSTQSERDEKIRELLGKILTDLSRLSRERSIQLVLVYLPTIWELENRPLPGWSPHAQWTEFLRLESRRLNIPLINVFDTFSALTHPEMISMFIPEQKLPYPEARFHMNERGNEITAKALYQAVVANRALACALNLRSRPEQNKLLRAGSQADRCGL